MHAHYFTMSAIAMKSQARPEFRPQDTAVPPRRLPLKSPASIFAVAIFCRVELRRRRQPPLELSPSILLRLTVVIEITTPIAT